MNIKHILAIVLLGGVGYGAYRAYKKGRNKVIDTKRLQIALGNLNLPSVDKGFLTVPLELTVNNPTNSTIDTTVIPLTAFAELSLDTTAGSQPLFSGIVDLKGTKIEPNSITTVPLTLRSSLIQLGAALLSLGGLKNATLKIVPRLGLEELPPITSNFSLKI